MGRGRTRKKQEIFDLYKSQHFEQGDKVSKPFVKYFLVAILFFSIGFYYFYTRTIVKFSKATEKPVAAPAVQTQPSSLQNFRSSDDNGRSFESDKKKQHVKSRSYLSAKENNGWVYMPLSSLVVHDGTKQVLYVPYQKTLIPLSAYPFKTIVQYKSGRPLVYELKPIESLEEKGHLGT